MKPINSNDCNLSVQYNVLPICLKPKTEIEELLYEGIKRAFGCSPVRYSLYQFYIDILGLDPYKTVLYNSFDNPIRFSYDDMSQNTREISLQGDVIFKQDSIDPNDNKGFSDFYCEMVTRLKGESYSYNNQNERIEQLLEVASELEIKINGDQISNVKRKIYSRQYQNLIKSFDELIEGEVYITLDNVSKSCAMIQCASKIECPDYDQEKLGHYVMEIKEHMSKETYYAPKVNFEINVENLKSTKTEKSYIDMITKVKKGESDPEDLAEHLNYFQTYYAHQIFQDTAIKGKVMVAFETLTKVPIKFSAWFDSKIYQIAINNKEINLNDSDYLIYTEYCRIPKKVIIGVNPTIIYSKSLGIFTDSSEEKNHQYHAGISDYYVISKDEQNSVVVLGYEVDNSLCSSPLIGAFKGHDTTNDVLEL